MSVCGVRVPTYCEVYAVNILYYSLLTVPTAPDRSLNLFYTKHSATNYMRNSPSNILTSFLKMVYSLSCKYTLIILHLYQYAMITYIT